MIEFKNPQQVIFNWDNKPDRLLLLNIANAQKLFIKKNTPVGTPQITAVIHQNRYHFTNNIGKPSSNPIGVKP